MCLEAQAALKFTLHSLILLNTVSIVVPPRAQASVGLADSGSYLFRSDYNGSKKHSSGKAGRFQTPAFLLAAGSITFQVAGSGGYLALFDCRNNVEVLKLWGAQASASGTDIEMDSREWTSSELAPYAGTVVRILLVDDNTTTSSKYPG